MTFACLIVLSPSHSYDVTIHIYLHTVLDAEQQLRMMQGSVVEENQDMG
jgi:hypothetical protein